MNKFDVNAGLDFYKDSKKDKQKKALEYFKNFFGKDDIEVYLRVIDPRVNHYSVYMEITKEDETKILNEYSCNVERNILGMVKSISIIGKVSFKIFNCKGKKRENLIEKHIREYEAEKERAKAVMF